MYEALKIMKIICTDYRIVVLSLIPWGFCMFGGDAKNILRGLTADPVREGTKGGCGEDRRGAKGMRFGRTIHSEPGLSYQNDKDIQNLIEVRECWGA
jgi:hypothetical protein